MRMTSTLTAVLALSAFAIAPATACPWDKTAKADKNMTVADTAPVPTVETDISIATNDLSQAVVEEQTILSAPSGAPAE